MNVQKFSDSELSRLHSMSFYENQLKAKGYLRIAGIDEAGRGPLAGPVVAAACVLPENTFFAFLNDSKQLSEEKREKLFSAIANHPEVIYGIGMVDVETIDRINILQATFLAMQKAVEAMSHVPDYLLIDGNQRPSFSIPSEAVVQGDALSVSIAGASILAKVTRDRIMEGYDRDYPEYGFKQHKGYGTALHRKAIEQFGPCPIHRKSFEPIKSVQRSIFL